MTPAEVDHAAAALARLAQEYRGKENFEALLNVFNTHTQGLEQALQDLLLNRSLDTAEGAQLDTIGSVIAYPRDTSDDATYRLRLRAKIKTIRSSGTVPQLLEIVELLYPTQHFTLTRYAPAGFVIKAGGTGDDPGTPASLAQIMIFFIRQARAAGARGILEYNTAGDADTFRLDGGIGEALDVGVFADALI